VAFRRLVDNPRFKNWHRVETARRLQQDESLERLEARINAAVEHSMRPENIKIEYGVA
jgi:hypothetical protein